MHHSLNFIAQVSQVYELKLLHKQTERYTYAHTHRHDVNISCIWEGAQKRRRKDCKQNTKCNEQITILHKTDAENK